MPSCFSCENPIETTDPVGRRDSCAKCHADLHCCKNCEFYDPSAYNECHEPQADRVLDKEKSNFCDYFQFAQVPHAMKERDTVAEAKRKLEALFK
ncbi:MAG: hypothetical protein HYY44_00380 [Deltaproteobacteria bacterium]|nr:hypothetical protein [Deltaproteobacteria bacterium]MBI4374556.1 hypothetical protein [Deltaproteobacteria bacterium]